jgi:enoyl-[acyl-carrier protein] reductase I
MAKAALPMMEAAGGALTLSHLGAVRPAHHNVMGSPRQPRTSVYYMAQSPVPKHLCHRGMAGPIKTLAASGIANFGEKLDIAAKNSPLRRNVTIEEVGNAAAFLLSDLASGITGEITYVDAGFNSTAGAES